MIYCRATDAVAHAPTKQCQVDFQNARPPTAPTLPLQLRGYGRPTGSSSTKVYRSPVSLKGLTATYGNGLRASRTISVPGACPHATSLDRIRPGGQGNGHTTPPALPGACLDHQYCTLHRHAWILEPSATGLCEPDLHVFAKLFEDRLERGLEAQALSGRQIGGDDDVLNFFVGHLVDVDLTRQPAS